MSRGLVAFSVVSMLVASLAGCGSVIPRQYTGDHRDFDFASPGCVPQAYVPAAGVDVRYLGSGGVAIGWKGDTILLGPYFSHAGSVVRAAFGKVKPDEARIAEGLEGIDRASVRAILLGHSHFDHIGDIPYLGFDNVPTYVNATGLALLAPYEKINKQPITTMPFDVSPNVRVQAYTWNHAPQLCRANHCPCTYADCDVVKKPRPFEQMRMKRLCGGQTYAYVIELRDGDETKFRIYYNDAAAADSTPMPPPQTYDLAIICMASYDFVHGYPDALLGHLKPRHVLISHYEDFFRKQQGGVTFVPLMTDKKAACFMARLDKSTKNVTPRGPDRAGCGVSTERWSMLLPHESIHFTATGEPR